MVKVKVNGVEVEVPDGSCLIDAIKKAGFKVPVLCYLEKLFNEATCRICVVKANGRVVPACRFPVQDELKVVTDDDELEGLRRVNFELVLATHNINCWDCFRKSSCILNELARSLGVEGLPVCSECPLHGDFCLVRRGAVCLGPLTISGCDAECTKQGVPCLGCRGFIKSEDTWRSALEFYWKNGLGSGDLENAISIFWHKLPGELLRLLKEADGS